MKRTAFKPQCFPAAGDVELKGSTRFNAGQSKEKQ